MDHGLTSAILRYVVLLPWVCIICFSLFQLIPSVTLSQGSVTIAFARKDWIPLHSRTRIADLSPTNSATMSSLAPSLDPRPIPRGRVWGKTLPGSVLSTGMLPSVLMRERTSLQPTSVRVRLITGSEYTVEHRNFENWSSIWPIALKIWKRKFAEFETRHSSKTLPSKVIPQTLPRGLGLGSRLAVNNTFTGQDNSIVTVLTIPSPTP